MIPKFIKLYKGACKGKGIFESEYQYQKRLDRNNIILSPYNFKLSEAKRLHEWFGRLVIYLESQRK